MKKIHLGFTLIELLVVVGIISILAAVGYANFSESTEISRDAQRKSDLRNLQTAIELYKNDNGRYPEGCETAGTWSAQAGTHACGLTDDGNQYIRGLAPKYIKVLPRDPKLNGLDSGYMYVTNVDGTVYKVMARKTVESEVFTYTSSVDELKSCDSTNSSTGMCDNSNGGSRASGCYQVDDEFRYSYGVWGGWSGPNAGVSITFSGYDDQVMENTQDIVCKM